MSYSKYLDNRAKLAGIYIVDNNCTVRAAASALGVPKSTVHIDVTRRLPIIDPTLARGVRQVLDKNLAERSSRAGKATRLVYLARRNQKGE